MYYVYKRVSTQTQMENNGLQMQEEVIAKFCEDKCIEIEETYHDDGISGTITERPGIMSLLGVLEEGDFIIVQNTSRLWRSDQAKVLIQMEIKKAGADVISIEQPTYSVYTRDPNDFLINSIMELLDQYDRMAIAMKLAKGRRAAANRGKKPGGRLPYGYKWENNSVVIDYNNNIVVEEIFYLALQGLSIGRIAMSLAERGYRTNAGKEFSKQTISNILHNDFYIGIVTHAGIKTAGNHESIITKELFDAVQKKLA